MRDSRVELHRLDGAGNHDPALAWSVWRLLRESKPDVVHTWLPQMDIVGGIAAVLQRIPLVVSERSCAAAYGVGWKNRVRQRVGLRATAIVANSTGGVDYWRPLAATSRLHLVRNCVALPDPHEARGNDMQAPAGPLVVFAGRFSPEKNIDRLIDALVEVARQRPDASIRLFGEGPLRASASERVAAAGLTSRIVVGGYTDRLGAWLARANVCVSVSHFEGHPNVVTEAAATGCPMVLSNIEAHRELFDDESAVFVPTESPGAIADGVLAVLQDPQSAARRATAACRIARRFSVAASAAAYRSIYESAAAADRR
jgi:glycosyltransferase involved in cell wall biosynthesis